MLEHMFPGPRRRAQRRYHRGAGFILDPLAYATPLDRNARARLMHRLEALERLTLRKRREAEPGVRNGRVSIPGLMVLRALMFTFANAKTGLCFPSYDAIHDVTGLSRRAIADGLARLVDVGALKITPRLCRVPDENGRAIVRNTSNLYAFLMPGGDLGGANGLPVVRPIRARVSRDASKPRESAPREGVFDFGSAFSYEAALLRRRKAGLGKL
jgi:hypothetical protein